MHQYETDKDPLIGNTTCVTTGDNGNADNADDGEDYQNTVSQKVRIWNTVASRFPGFQASRL